MAHRAAEDAAQHVAAPLVARDHAVGEQEGDRPQVIGDHPQRDVLLGVGAVLRARQLRRRGEDRLEEVGVVVRVHPLEHGGDPLQAHAGVDRRLGQRRQGPRRVAVVLHEDQVPDLHVAPGVRPLLPAHLGQLGVDVDEDLAARAAGAGVAHRPEVVLLAATVDPLGAQARQLHPEVERLVVLFIDGGEEPAGGQAPDAGHQVPAEADGVLLEVVAEGEVAQHLEEGVMARARPHVLEVVVLAGDAHHLLRRGGARRLRPLDAEEVVLELDHSGIGEQQGGIALRNQGRARHDAVPALPEEFEKACANVRLFMAL